MDEPTRTTETSKHKAAPNKKPYAPPGLIEHGSVAEITAGDTGQVADQDLGSMNVDAGLN